MAWDEWEQLKKQAAERGSPHSRRDAAVEHARAEGVEGAEGTAELPTEGLEDQGPVRGQQSEAEAAEREAARRMERIRHTIDSFRDTAVLVPVEREAGFLTADFGGVRWIYAFTSVEAVARFSLMQGGLQGKRDCISVLGWRLLDVVIPAMGIPCGVALDVGSGDDGVLLPPVVGIVPDAVAVNAAGNGDSKRNGERPW
jgi:hypothetical protein